LTRMNARTPVDCSIGSVIIIFNLLVFLLPGKFLLKFVLSVETCPVWSSVRLGLLGLYPCEYKREIIGGSDGGCRRRFLVGRLCCNMARFAIDNQSLAILTKEAASTTVGVTDESEALLDLPVVTSESAESIPEVRAMGE
jgi:hypothetical protein